MEGVFKEVVFYVILFFMSSLTVALNELFLFCWHYLRCFYNTCSFPYMFHGTQSGRRTSTALQLLS